MNSMIEVLLLPLPLHTEVIFIPSFVCFVLFCLLKKTAKITNKLQNFRTFPPRPARRPFGAAGTPPRRGGEGGRPTPRRGVGRPPPKGGRRIDTRVPYSLFPIPNRTSGGRREGRVETRYRMSGTSMNEREGKGMRESEKRLQIAKLQTAKIARESISAEEDGDSLLPPSRI